MNAAKLDRRRGLPLVLSALAVSFTAAAGLAAIDSRAPAAGGENAATVTPIRSVDDLSTAFERVADSIHRSVVSIKSVNRIELRRAAPRNPFHSFPFDDFFGPAPFGQQPDGQGRGFVQQGLGTGFIISEDGYVVTNDHVVKDADEVTVTLWDESTYTATIVGTDSKTDLAVLRIDAEGLVPAPLGDDKRLRVGHWVAAVGNPFGLSSTMTAGIVSAVGRSRVGLADYEDFIQTDAAINPGNSGGPLVNLAGEVVGINTAIFSRTGGYMGIGFAIPIGMARSIVDSLIADGRVDRGFLGVIIQDLDKGLAESFGYEGTRGALVSDVSPGSPAAEAGIRAGDILLSFDGKEVEDVDMLRLLVASTRPGSEVDVRFLRDGERLDRSVEIGALEADARSSNEPHKAPQQLGMSLETLTPPMARRLDLDTTRSGVLVTRVDPFGAAARAGIRLNDVILAVGDEEVANVRDFERELSDAHLDRGVRLTVQTGAARRFVFLRVED